MENFRRISLIVLIAVIISLTLGGCRDDDDYPAPIPPGDIPVDERPINERPVGE